MKDTEVEALEPVIDAAGDAADQWLDSQAIEPVKRAIREANAKLPEGMSITLSCVLDVFDEKRDAQVRLLETGITAGKGEPYRCDSDSTMQRYLMEGELCELPHDHCPSCWGTWDFKDRNRTCPNCGVTLSREVKILLDSDVCPHCEEGRVTAESPTCDRCGYEVDLSIVAWG